MRIHATHHQGGGGGTTAFLGEGVCEYLYIRVLLNEFLLKTVVFTAIVAKLKRGLDIPILFASHGISVFIYIVCRCNLTAHTAHNS